MNNAVTCWSFTDRIDLGPVVEIDYGEDVPDTIAPLCDACDEPGEVLVDGVLFCAACAATSEGAV